MKLALLIVLCCIAASAQTAAPRVEVSHPTIDAEGVATEPASVCLVSGTARQCYTAPKNDLPFGLNPKAYPVNLKQGVDGLLFTATASGGGSGSTTIFALLVVKRGRLENLLPEVKVSEQSEHQIWKEPLISDLPIIVTATYEWGDGETHFSAHRFRISTYVFGHQLQNYTLQDEYITAKKYASFDQADKITVLQNEKSEILTRLRRQSN
jgi:hypothetical protein